MHTLAFAAPDFQRPELDALLGSLEPGDVEAVRLHDNMLTVTLRGGLRAAPARRLAEPLTR